MIAMLIRSGGPWHSFLSSLILFVFAFGLGLFHPVSSLGYFLDKKPMNRPNVLFIAIDDQNDWLGCLGGHRAASTPCIDELARQGVLFSNAHCQAPLCNPSRTSVLLGLRPSTTGIYGLSPWFRDVKYLQDRVTLPQHFQQHGYQTLTSGKIFHGPPAGARRDREFDVWGPAGGIGITPPKKLIPMTPMGNHPLMDWGAFEHSVDQKGDYQIASWAMEQLKTLPRDRPFFLSVGFFLPHVPCYVTPEQLDAVPNDPSMLPLIDEDDRNDVPRFSWYLHWELPEPRLNWIRKEKQWLPLVRSYLASTSMIDAQVGRILQTLRDTGHDRDTIVVLWSDHGFHLGEKGITGKNTLWERSTRVPLVFAGPGIVSGGTITSPVELLDIYPTLIELCGLSSREDLEGISLSNQLADPTLKKEGFALTTHNEGNHAVRDDQWRYIRYADGSEELYDLWNDPREWTNQASDALQQQRLIRMRKLLPTKNLPPAPGSAHRVLTYDAGSDEAVWEGKKIGRLDPIPE